MTTEVKTQKVKTRIVVATTAKNLDEKMNKVLEDFTFPLVDIKVSKSGKLMCAEILYNV